MKNFIAARIGCYQDHQDAGWAHLSTIGVHHVEISMPKSGELDTVKQRLDTNGLSASSIEARCDIQQANVAESMIPAFDACAALGAKICFISVHADELPRDTAWQRLRAIGDEAAARDITACMETHPDLAFNGEIALETMKAVDHPNVRINFDTANIYYYNHECTTMSELEKIIDYVGSVHIKDSTGGYRKDIFPTVGTGIIDFPEVFRVLGESGFTGPYTLELEGSEKRTLEGQLKHVADSVEYLRSIGAFG
jgi:L-ribulose-5-phosphate 3-epimerase